MYLEQIGRVQDARSISKRTSMEKLRSLLLFDTIDEMFEFFSHRPCVSNPNGGQPSDPIPCYLLFGETSVKVTRFVSGKDLVEYIGLDYMSSQTSIFSALQGRGSRTHIGKYVFAITRYYTTSIESIPETKNDYLTIRIAAMLEGVPKVNITMHDIAIEVGVRTGKGVVRRLCEHFGIKYHGICGSGNPHSIYRQTALTNLRTREVYEFRSISDASRFLRASHETIRSLYREGDTILYNGDRYSIDIDYS